MAPGFFSKLVKPQSGNRHERDSSQSRPISPSSSTGSKGTSESARARALSTPDPHHSFRVIPPPHSPSKGSLSSDPSVTVIPPSPRSYTSSVQSDLEILAAPQKKEPEPGRSSRRKRPSSLTNLDGSTASETDNGMPTPTPASNKTLGVNSATRPLAPSSSTGNLRDRVRSVVSSRSSSRSRTNLVESPTPTPPLPSTPHRAATVSPEEHRAAEPHTSMVNDNGPRVAIVPLADSITGTPEFQTSPTTISMPTSNQTRAFTIAVSNPTPTPESQFLSPDRVRDSDSVSISSTASGRKRRLWRRSSTTSTAQASPKRKTTGLASAIVASVSGSGGPSSSGAPAPSPSASPPRRKSSTVKRSPALSGHHAAASQSSIDTTLLQLSPPAMGSRHDSLPTRSPEHESDDVSSADGHDDDDDSDDDALLAELNDGDIPVTGFAVASNKRNADFHDLFRTIPEGDYLIEDYGCALQREILVQGRIYISENHICFHANIFGWVTDLIVPIYDIVSLEKKMTAFVIPNAIQITTRTTKHTFASFLARDTAYDVIYNIWRLARPEDGLSEDEGVAMGRPALEATRGLGSPTTIGSPTTPARTVVPPVHKVTQCACGREGLHYSEPILDAVLPGTPERIYNLIYASGFSKEFMSINQKLDDIQISDWAPCPGNPGCLARNMSYIKPLGGGIGPKSAKCEIRDETVYSDFDDYVVTVTTTRTPDVPSGGVFSVKTRTCITWASSASSRVVVTSQVEWTGRSFIKGIIEKSALEGQRSYQRELERAMRSYIHEHQSEFIPPGLDPAAVAEAVQGQSAPTTPTMPTPSAPQSEEAARKEREKEREQERNQRGLQWAYDTLEGAISVGQQSATGAIELIRDAWDQSSTSTILYFVITFLVLSNLWTLMLVGKREEAGRRKEMRRTEEREKWVQGIVTALWEELAAGRQPGALPAAGSQAPQGVRLPESWRDEVAELGRSLDAVEERLRLVRQSLQELD